MAKVASGFPLALVLTSLAFFRPLQPVSGQPSSDATVIPVTVRTPHSGFNRLVVTVTICQPGTDHCATIDDVMLDTGSTGLRLESSAVPMWMRLPAFAGADGKPLAECLHFVHDAAWGPLVRADLRMGGMRAANLPLQIIADDGRPQPEACPASAVKPTSNGTLGIGQHLLDCQGTCEQNTRAPGVFVENNGTWSPIRDAVPPESRLPNPVSRFEDDGNGVVIDLPASSEGGSDEVVGTLTFGVNTAPNNQLGTARIVRLDASGRFTTLLGAAAYPDSYIDSGTETYIFADDGLQRCVGMTWAFCVAPAQMLDATIVGVDGLKVPVTFKVGDYRGALDRHVGAWDGFAEVAAPSSKAFVWGAPFFIGRRVSVVFDGMAIAGTKGIQGPFYAFR